MIISTTEILSSLSIYRLTYLFSLTALLIIPATSLQSDSSLSSHSHTVQITIVTPSASHLICQEFCLATDSTPSKVMWIHRSTTTEAGEEDTILVSMSQQIALTWSGRLHLFGQAVVSQPLCSKTQLVTCNTCFRFHHLQNCACPPHCEKCSASKYEDLCSSSPHCLNCCRPHLATDPACPAYPTHRNSALSKPTTSQLRVIRANRSTVWHTTNPLSTISATLTSDQTQSLPYPTPSHQ